MSDTITATLRTDRAVGKKWLECDSKPEPAIITALKAAGWRWGGYRKQWYGSRYAQVPAAIICEDGGDCEYSAERADRLTTAATKIQAKADDLWERSGKMADVIPFGQPILVGHHSEKRDRNYRAKIARMSDKAIEEAHKAEELARAAKGSARNQRLKRDPGVVARRIARMKADRVACVNSHAHNMDWLRYDKVAAETLAATEAGHVQRLAVIDAEIATEQAYLDSLGGMPFDSLDLHVGDTILDGRGCGVITKISPKNIALEYINKPHGYWRMGKIERSEVRAGCVIARATEHLSEAEILDRHWDLVRPTSTEPPPAPEGAAWQERAQAVKRAARIREMEDAVIRAKTPGYFPTPPDLAADLAQRLYLAPGMQVLEPSAGKGDLADAILQVMPSVDLTLYELEHRLCEILILKGYRPIGANFCDIPAEPTYDRILMNPPFEYGHDMAHVKRAYRMLKDGGRMIAIISSAFQYRSHASYQEFAQWLDEVGAEVEALPDGTFLLGDRPTGVRAVVVTIDK